MSQRKDLLVNNNVYHIYNKTIAPFKSFIYEQYALRFVELFTYYRSEKTIAYSKYRKLNEKQRSMLPSYSAPHVEILSYCLMPNHYHFQLKQIGTNGINIFISNVVNAFTRYYNILNDRKGPLFLPVFHSQIAYSVEQLLHTSRYIHLNPVKDGLVKNFEDLTYYKFSSFDEYMGKPKLCNTDIVLHYFDNDIDRYKKFLEDDVEHQKVLKYVREQKKRNQFIIYRGNASKNRAT